MNIGDEPDVHDLIALAKKEDFGSGDISATLLPDANASASFSLVAKQPCVFCGQKVAESILRAYEDCFELRWASGISDGHKINDTPKPVATITGPYGAMLSAERVLLNFLQRLCGVATETRRFVDAVRGTNATILDTRKTTPGWRTLEKYAVRCGGGANHRSGLYDAVLIKDNHLADIPAPRLASHIFEMLNRMHESGIQPRFVEVEVDTLEQLAEVFNVVGIDIVLLDNFSTDQLRQAVELRQQRGLCERIQLEASGKITLNSVREVAETGVDRISVGALTHSATAIDLSLERV